MRAVKTNAAFAEAAFAEAAFAEAAFAEAAFAEAAFAEAAFAEAAFAEAAFAEAAFAELVRDAQGCRACPRMEGRRRVLSPANGPLSARVLFVAEAPGRLGGDTGGVPLTGDASGRNFARYLAAAGLRREDVFVTNAALCNPRTSRGTNAPPSPQELRNCGPFLARTLAIVRPSVVVTLGTKALAALHLLSPHAYNLRGHAAAIQAWNGVLLFPLYHPSPQVAISPTGRTHAAQEADYRALGQLLEQPFLERPFLEHESL